MFWMSLAAAIVLLDSRYIFHTQISQPLVMAAILTFAGGEGQFLFLSAAAVHLLYIGKKPSGATLFPEYPFAYFISACASWSLEKDTAVFIVFIFVCLLLSGFTAVFLKYKRLTADKYRGLALLSGGAPDMPKTLMLSFVTISIYSAGLIFISSALFELARTYGRGFADLLPDTASTGIALCAALAVYQTLMNLRERHVR